MSFAKKIYDSPEEREQYIKFGYSFQRVRPSLHIISKVTGALFFFSLAIYSGWFKTAYNKMPIPTNIFLVGIAYLAADYLEDKVSHSINGFCFAAVRAFKSWRNGVLALASFVLMVFAVSVGAVTSFNGIQGNIQKSDLGLNDAQEKSEKIEGKKGNAGNDMLKNIERYKAERAKQRKDKKAKFEEQKTAAAKECKSAYESKEDIAHCKSEKYAAIDADTVAILDMFDTETINALQSKERLLDKELEAAQKDKSNETDLLYGELNMQNDQIAFVAWFVGIGAVGFEVFALIAALLVYYIRCACECTEKEMAEIGAEKTDGMGIFPKYWYKIWNKLFANDKKKH